MRIKDKAKAKVPPVEPGVYMAVCVGVIDLGEQFSEKFKNYANKLKIVWELCGETVEIDGEQKPRQLSKEFTFSANKKSNLRAFLTSWNGKVYSDEEFGELEIFDQLGKACQLQVVLNDTGEYANIDTIMAIPKGFPVPKTDTPFIRWDMDAWDDAVFDTLPEWTQEQIKKSTQYQKAHAPEDELEIKVDAATGEVREGNCPI